MRNLKINIPLFFIVLIILINNNFFYIFREINEIVNLSIVILFIIYSYFITIKDKDKKKNPYILNILTIILLIITSSFAAKNSYNQPILLGIRPQRAQLVYYFSYFAIFRLIMHNKIDMQKLKKSLYIIGILEIIIYGLFWISNGRLTFIHMPFDYRYNSIRLRGNSLILIFLFILSLNDYLNNKNKLKNFIMLLSIFTFELFCNQTRLLILAYSISLLIIFILWKKNLMIKMCFIPIIAVAIFMFSQTNMGKDLINSIIFDKTDSSYDIREVGKEFYLEDYKKSKIIGRGFINTQWSESVSLSKMNKNIYAVDNGIIAFLWIYGYIGIIWLIFLLGRMISTSLNLYKKQKNYIGLIFILMNIVLSPNIIWWWWSKTYMFMSMLMLVLIEYEVRVKSERICYEDNQRVIKYNKIT